VVIDRDGLFYGDRLKKCGQEAQLYWPRYFVASNTCARLELDYGKILTTVYWSFDPARGDKIPTYDEFWKNHIAQYNTNYLLFCYEVNGRIWGQWDTDEHFLCEYKLKADKRTPEPPAEPFQHWKDAYKAMKQKNSAKPFDLNTLVVAGAPSEKSQKDFQKISNISDGVGGGVGKERQGKVKATPTLRVTLPSWVSKEVWDAFVEMRNKLRKPLTDEGRPAVILRLDTLRTDGNDPSAVLRQSIMNSWQGVFELKDRKAQPYAVKPSGANYQTLDPKEQVSR
jgi:hypothetical protein